MKKQLVSILFALCMVLCLVPLAVFAEGETENVQAVTDQTTLVAAMADGTVTTVKLVSDIDIDATLTVNRTVTLNLNGKVLQMTGNGSVITIKDGGNLTLTDSNTTAEHKFTPNGDGLWVSEKTAVKPFPAASSPAARERTSQRTAERRGIAAAVCISNPAGS